MNITRCRDHKVKVVKADNSRASLIDFISRACKNACNLFNPQHEVNASLTFALRRAQKVKQRDSCDDHRISVVAVQ